LVDTTENPTMDSSADVDLDGLVQRSDEALRRELPAVLDAVERSLEAVVDRQFDAFVELLRRMSTMDGVTSYAQEEPETVDRFLAVFWDGVEYLVSSSLDLEDTITEELSVTWVAVDSEVSFHMRTRPESSGLEGGPGVIDDPDLEIEGTTDALFSLLYDEDFEPELAVYQGELDFVGPMHLAWDLAEIFGTIRGRIEDRTDVD
jgi:hypothetical protein